MNEEATPFYDLSTTELRVLGCLMEKELTTPDQYPLTENALKLACNQKTNRDPVMSLDSGEVLRTARELEEKDFTRSERSSRAERFKNTVRTTLQITRSEQAVLCMIMLRGPQTLSELKARTERMIRETDDPLQQAINSLEEKGFLKVLSRQSGQREDRYQQLVFPQEITLSRPAASVKSTVDRNANEERIAALEEQVKVLTQRVAALENPNH